MRETTVAAVMTTEVVTATPDTSFKDLVTTLTGRRISALPVVDEAGRPVGVVSEADVLAKQEFHGGRDELPHGDRAARDRWYRSLGHSAAEVMSTPVRAIRADEPVSAAARLLAAAHVRRLFVVDADGRLVGVVSRRDLLRVYDQTADELRARIEELMAEAGVVPGTVVVGVAEGTVTLAGLLERRSLLDAVVRMVRAVPGVVGVHNDLRYGIDDTAVAGWPGFSP